MRNSNLTRIIRSTVYQLKQTYGTDIVVRKTLSSETDYRTGEVVANYEHTFVRRAILLPNVVTRGSYVSPWYTQTNKPFVTKGGMGWDDAARLFIFDARDLPINFEFELEDSIVKDQNRFDIKMVEDVGEGVCWAVWTTQAQGTTQATHKKTVSDSLSVTDQAGGVL
jgi:hypothetical protein